MPLIPASPKTVSDPLDAAPVTSSVSVVVPPVTLAPSETTVSFFDRVSLSCANRWSCTVVSPLTVTPVALTKMEFALLWRTVVVPVITCVVPVAVNPDAVTCRVVVAPLSASVTDVLTEPDTESPPADTRPDASRLVTPATAPVWLTPALLLSTPCRLLPCDTLNVPVTDAFDSTVSPPVPTTACLMVASPGTVTPVSLRMLRDAVCVSEVVDISTMLESETCMELLSALPLPWLCISAPPDVTVSFPPSVASPDVLIVVTPTTAPTPDNPPFRLSMPCSVDP